MSRRRRRRVADDPPMQVTPQVEAWAKSLYEGVRRESSYAPRTLPWESLSNIVRNSWRRVAYEHVGSLSSSPPDTDLTEQSQ